MQILPCYILKTPKLVKTPIPNPATRSTSSKFHINKIK